MLHINLIPFYFFHLNVLFAMHLFIHYQKCPEIFRHTQSLVTSSSVCKMFSHAFQLRTTERFSFNFFLKIHLDGNYQFSVNMKPHGRIGMAE